MKKHVVLTMMVLVLLTVCNAGAIAAADQPAKNLETRVIQLEADKQVNDARWDKDNEIKQLLKDEIGRSKELQEQTKDYAVKSIETIKNIVYFITVVLTILGVLVAFFGLKSYWKIKKRIGKIVNDSENKINKIVADSENKINKIVADSENKINKKIEHITSLEKEVERIANEVRNACGGLEEINSQINEMNPQIKEMWKDLSERTDILKKEWVNKGIKIPGKQTNITTEDKDKFNKVISKLRTDEALGKSLTATDYLLLGDGCFYDKKYSEAIEKYQKALEIDPDYVDAYCNLGNVLDEQKKYFEAITEYKKALAINPNAASAYCNWGVTLSKQLQYSNAIKKYIKAIQIDSDCVEAYYNWGNALVKCEKYSEAIKKYQKTIEIKPDYAVAYYNRACAYSLMNDAEKSCQDLEMAIKFDLEYKEKTKTESDFDTIRNDERFKKLVGV